MSSDNTLKYYNASDLWSGEPTTEQRLLLNKTLNMFPEDIKSILDVGCGNGVITNQLPSDIYVCGLDISDEALKYLKRDKKVGSVDNLPFGNDEFDLLLSTDTIEHLPVEIYHKGIKELKRVAKKYIMIAVPYREELEYAKAKCSECGCEYHINWHLRSLSIKKIVDEIGTDKFYLFSVGFSGDFWPYYCDVIDKVDRIMNKKFHSWDKAICPLCGSSETVRPKDSIIEGLGKLKKDCFMKRLRDNPNSLPSRNEMILLFRTNSCNNETFDGFDKKMPVLYIKTNKANMDSISKVRLTKMGKYDIMTGSNIFSRGNTHKYCSRPYILENETNNWGNIVSEDGKLARRYESKKNSSGHAVFVIPGFTNSGFNIVVSYKDCSDTPITLQVYDRDKSYIKIGNLECKNDYLWKTSVFAVPSDIDYLDEGYIFDFVCNYKESEPNYYIDKILIDESSVKVEELKEINNKGIKNGLCRYYELNIHDVLLNDTIINAEMMESTAEFGIIFNNIIVKLDKYKLTSYTYETAIYKWIFDDPYFNELLNISELPCSGNDETNEYKSLINDYYYNEFNGFKEQVNQLSVKISDLNNQLEGKDNQLEELRKVVDRLKNRKLLDYILRKEE